MYGNFSTVKGSPIVVSSARSHQKLTAALDCLTVALWSRCSRLVLLRWASQKQQQLRNLQRISRLLSSDRILERNPDEAVLDPVYVSDSERQQACHFKQVSLVENSKVMKLQSYLDNTLSRLML